MSLVGHTLLKRGLEAHAYISEKQSEEPLSPWAVAILFVTGMGFLYTLFTIEYTFGRVIPTLIMIESPEESYEAIPTKDGDNKSIEPVVSRPQYITASFCSTIKLLKAQGGYRGRFRGLTMYIAQHLAVNVVAGVLSMATVSFLPLPFYVAIASIVCAQLSLGWTLIVITENSSLSWFRRIPSIATWKKIAGPTAVYAIVQEVTASLPLYLLIGTGLTKAPGEVSKLPTREQQIMAGQAIGIILLQIALVVFAVIPAHVVLTRMQASLVSDSENTIVPFDRTFGGKVVPEVVGGSGMIGACAAWRTFDFSARIRLVKAYLKTFAMILTTGFLFAFIFAIEVAVLAPHLM